MDLDDEDLALVVAAKFAAAETVVLKMPPKHPLNGAKAEIVRRDPFNRFVIVKVLKTLGPYKKGDELNLKPENVSS